MKKQIKATWYKPSGKFYTSENTEIEVDDYLFESSSENILGARYMATHKAAREVIKNEHHMNGFFVVIEDIDPDAPVGSPNDILCFPELIIPN